MISYTPEEAELIESGALTNKKELLIIQYVACVPDHLGSGTQANNMRLYNMKLKKHCNIKISTHIADTLPPGGGGTPILDLTGCAAQQGVLLR